MTPEEAKKLYEEYGSARKASKIAGISRTTFRRRLNQAGVNLDNTSLETDFKQDEGTITTKSLNISTVDQALKYSKVDHHFGMLAWDKETRVRHLIIYVR